MRKRIPRWSGMLMLCVALASGLALASPAQAASPRKPVEVTYYFLPQ